MRNLVQRHWFTNVRQVKSGGELDAQTVYCGTDGEICTCLTVDPVSLKIKKATLEEYVPRVRIIEIHKLHGIEAYLNCGPQLRSGLDGYGDFTRTLFAETVRGIIQAETFIWKERGFPSPAEYSQHWEDFYRGSCYYYSNLEQISQKWDEYTSCNRSPNLFNRFKHLSVNEEPGPVYRVNMELSDSFHEISVNLTTDHNFKVIRANGNILRSPDKICRNTTTTLKNLIELNLIRLNKKQVASLLGKGNGCVHLIDIVYDVVETMKIASIKGVE